MDLYLVRHAIADDRDPARWPDDSVRPLTADGIERFRRAARGLRTLVPTVDAVLSSGFTRAWQTAELLHEEAGWPAPSECEALEAGRAPADAVDVLRDRNESSLALVGHEPHLSLLASLLLTGDEDAVQMDLKKGGTIALAVPGRIEPRGVVLVWSAAPRLLRRIAG
ncbi:MAG TPA: histidine phosphatase family protein [Gaiellaceae bacterium]